MDAQAGLHICCLLSSFDTFLHRLFANNKSADQTVLMCRLVNECAFVVLTQQCHIFSRGGIHNGSTSQSLFIQLLRNP